MKNDLNDVKKELDHGIIAIKTEKGARLIKLSPPLIKTMKKRVNQYEKIIKKLMKGLKNNDKNDSAY